MITQRIRFFAMSFRRIWSPLNGAGVSSLTLLHSLTTVLHAKVPGPPSRPRGTGTRGLGLAHGDPFEPARTAPRSRRNRPLEQLGDQISTGATRPRPQSPCQLGQMHRTGLVHDRDTADIGGHVRHYKVDRPAPEPAAGPSSTASCRNRPAGTSTPAMGSIGSTSSAITRPFAPTSAAATWDQPPGAAPRSTTSEPGLRNRSRSSSSSSLKPPVTASPPPGRAGPRHR